MKVNLIEKLRNSTGFANSELATEALDEIERLRAEVSRLMKIICDASPDDDYLLVRKECDAIWEGKIYA